MIALSWILLSNIINRTIGSNNENHIFKIVKDKLQRQNRPRIRYMKGRKMEREKPKKKSWTKKKANKKKKKREDVAFFVSTRAFGAFGQF
jgi:uncharacterized protein HemY